MNSLWPKGRVRNTTLVLFLGCFLGLKTSSRVIVTRVTRYGVFPSIIFRVDGSALVSDKVVFRVRGLTSECDRKEEEVSPSRMSRRLLGMGASGLLEAGRGVFFLFRLFYVEVVRENFSATTYLNGRRSRRVSLEVEGFRRFFLGRFRA